MAKRNEQRASRETGLSSGFTATQMTSADRARHERQAEKTAERQVRLECMRLACQWPTASGAVDRAKEFYAFVKGD